jgi:hypothetical protein
MTLWGVAIALAGLAGSIWVAAALLVVAGAADSVSAVCRTTINQTVTPDAMRGRMSSVFSLVVTSGPRLGDVEAGATTALGGVRFSLVSGGLPRRGRRDRRRVPGAPALRRGTRARAMMRVVLPPAYFITATVLGLVAAVATLAAGALGPALVLLGLSAVSAAGGLRARRERR